MIAILHLLTFLMFTVCGLRIQYPLNKAMWNNNHYPLNKAMWNNNHYCCLPKKIQKIWFGVKFSLLASFYIGIYCYRDLLPV